MTVNGALFGGTTKPLNRYGDLENKISIGTAATYVAKKFFKEHSPYYREFTEEGALSILPTYHFIIEVRRHLSGEIQNGSSDFSPEEDKFYYKEYVPWVDGTTKYGEILLAVKALDKWLTDEVLLEEHPELNRNYEDWHPWVKPPADTTT